LFGQQNHRVKGDRNSFHLVFLIYLSNLLLRCKPRPKIL
jgi:hypothetical protein